MLILYIFRLNNNFFYKLKDIKRVNIQDWKSLDLPLNIYYLLNEKLEKANEDDNNNNNNLPSTNDIKLDVNNIVNKNNDKNNNNNTGLFSNKKPISNDSNDKNNKNLNDKLLHINNLINSKNAKDNNNNILIDKPSTTSCIKNNTINNKIVNKQVEEENLKSNVKKFLDNIVDTIKVQQDYSPILKTLYNILDKIRTNPKEITLQKLNKNSKVYQNKIKPYIGAINILNICGFEEEIIDSNTYLVYKGNIDELAKIVYLIEDYLTKNSNIIN